MADNEAVDVNITSSVNGDSSELDNLAAKKSEANSVSGDDHHLKARIEELEREKRELKREIEEVKAAAEQMAKEKDATGKKIGKMEAAEEDRNELERKAMESITKRAFELEGEVVRLQHDLGSAMSAGDEAVREIENLMGEIKELKREKSDSRSKISELEKKIEGLQESEREARREIAVAEEKAKARLDELESEIAQLKKEKTAVEDAMGTLEAELKMSEKKVIQMAERIEKLAENTQESEDIIAGMVEKASQRGIDGIVDAGERDAGFKGLKNKIQFPVVGAVSVGVVVAAIAVCYVRFSRTR